jgi:hypothetical protein
MTALKALPPIQVLVEVTLTLLTARLHLKLKVACAEVKICGESVFRDTQYFVPVPLSALMVQIDCTAIAVVPAPKMMVWCALVVLSLRTQL